MMDTPGEHGWDVRRTGRWRALTLLAATLVLAMSRWFSASAVIPQLRVQWNLSDSAAAWLTIAVQLGFVFGALISSLVNLSDVVSPRHVILGGAVGAATVNGLLVIAGSAAAGIPLRFATGFFLAGVYPPAFKLMSTWFKKGRGTALGILSSVRYGLLMHVRVPAPTRDYPFSDSFMD
jgi:MFS family permease